MKLVRAMVVARKEWQEIRRDRLFLALCLVVPVVLMLLFGYGLSLDVENIPFAVVDHDDTPASRDYASHFSDSRYFDFRGRLADEGAIDRLVAANALRAVLVIPPGFGRDLAAGRSVRVQTVIDGTFPVRAMTMRGYVLAINAQASTGIALEWARAATGADERSLAALAQPVRLETRNLYNQPLRSVWSMAPKLIMVILMIAPPFLTVLGVVREKESGSIFNIYASTVSKAEFLLGKLVPYVVISLFNALLLFLLARYLFGAPFKGDPLFFALATAMYVVCTTGIGLVISVLVRTQTAAMVVVAIVTVVPAALYSGAIIPIESLSPAAAGVAHLLPAMYYAQVATGSFLKGVGWPVLWPNLLVLAGYAALLMAAGYLLFSKRPRT
ncbi:MAG: ABC transporter permease [Rhodanobacteraceae bacterium]|jgi:ABC-2 type transport system permease protein/ribosome-dependent ATPase|nr:ABC transporter permease [Rhodanobacteraceae bacterium]